VSDFLVAVFEGRVEARSTQRLGYAKAEQKAFRTALEQACAGLIAKPEEVLYATYAAAGDDLVDVENVLTYNVSQAHLREAARHGLVLERAHAVIPDERFPDDHTHVMTYTLATDPSWRSWQPTKSLAEVVISDNRVLRGPTARGVWVAARRGTIIAHETTREVPERIAVEVTVGGTLAPSINLLSITKPVVDGLLAALHGYAGHRRSEVLDRLPSIVGPDEQNLGGWLAEDEAAPLGCTEFLLPWRDTIQISPADDRIVALRVRRDDNAGPAIRCHVSKAAAPVGDSGGPA